MCVGDCSERVRGWCVMETAVKELGSGVCDGDCSEIVRRWCVCWRLQ